jgi:hypothetical protein
MEGLELCLCHLQSPSDSGLFMGYVPDGTICLLLAIERNLPLWLMFVLQSRRNDHSKDVIRKLLLLDTISLSAHITTVVVDNSRCREALARRGSEAQSLLNLLQAVCPSVGCICILEGSRAFSVWIYL